MLGSYCKFCSCRLGDYERGTCSSRDCLDRERGRLKSEAFTAMGGLDRVRARTTDNKADGYWFGRKDPPPTIILSGARAPSPSVPVVQPDAAACPRPFQVGDVVEAPNYPLKGEFVVTEIPTLPGYPAGTVVGIARADGSNNYLMRESFLHLIRVATAEPVPPWEPRIGKMVRIRMTATGVVERPGVDRPSHPGRGHVGEYRGPSKFDGLPLVWMKASGIKWVVNSIADLEPA
jgi:hypothetical protein